MPRSLIALCLAVAGVPAFAALPEGVELLHYERLVPIERLEADAEAAPALAFHAYGRAFRLELVRHGLDGASARGDLELYRGTLAGDAGSWVRLSAERGRLSGLIWDGTELYAIDSADRLLPIDALGDGLAAETPLVFRMADLIVEPGILACATGLGGEALNGASAYRALIGELEAEQAAGAQQVIDIGMYGDFELFTSFGNNRATAENAIRSRMNTVDGIFSSQVGVEINVTGVTVFDTVDDPFIATLDPEELLDDVALFKSGEKDGDTSRRALGLLHLYTGRSFTDQTVGIAFRGTLCDARFSVGITERQNTSVIEALITAHEIGHNFGAIHDGDSTFDSRLGRQIDCSATPLTFLMAPNINSSNQFSQCSLETMADFMALVGCLTPIGPPDGTVITPAQTVVAGEGVETSIPLTGTNLGGENLTNVVVTMTPTSPALQLVSVTPIAPCSISNNVATCRQASLAPRADISISLRVRGDALGTFTIDTAISADNDSDASNDADSFDVRVDPSIDLALALSGPGEIDVGSAGRYRATMTNETPAVTATGVALRVTVPSGFTASNVSASAGSCSLQASEINCAIGNLTANATVDFDITASSTVTRNLTAVVSADQPDRDSSNDSGQLAVIATTTGSGGGGGSNDSGGGASGLLLLLALGSTLLARRRLCFRDRPMR